MTEQSILQTNTANHEKVKSAVAWAKYYPYYALFVLMMVYFFSVVDRQILAILAEDIKADLAISDAQMGFLYGTVFALFYSVFGIPLGKLSDITTRKNVVAVGIGFWSLMTVLTGLARNFFQLSICRVGVGVGESSASPAVYSLLSDYFSPKVRGTVISIYSGAAYIGSGMGLLLGGALAEWWNGLYPMGVEAPFGLAGWQAAFIIVGLPGLLMALLVYTLKEPARGAGDGLSLADSSQPQSSKPISEFLLELGAIIPPFTLWVLVRSGATKIVLVVNLLVALGLILSAGFLVNLLGADHLPQWAAVAIGCYGVFSWAQSLKLRDPVAFGMIFRCTSLMSATFGIAMISIVSTAFSLWMPVFFIRAFELPVDEAGRMLGLIMIAGGWLGVILGGVISDGLKRRYPSGRVLVALIVSITLIPTTLLVLNTDDLTLAYIAYFLMMVSMAMYIPTGPTIITDLVLPRMRAVASAFYIFVLGMLGYALGPYLVGMASDLLEPTLGADSLRYCLMGCLMVLLPGVVLLVIGMKSIGNEEANRLGRASALGEAV